MVALLKLHTQVTTKRNPGSHLFLRVLEPPQYTSECFFYDKPNEAAKQLSDEVSEV